MEPDMTLARLKADAMEGCISNLKSIRAILEAFANLSGRDVFPNASKEFDPLEELKAVTEIPAHRECRFGEITNQIYKETVMATSKSHIKDTEPYRYNMKALSLLSQLPHHHLPKLREKGD